LSHSFSPLKGMGVGRRPWHRPSFGDEGIAPMDSLTSTTDAFKRTPLLYGERDYRTSGLAVDMRTRDCSDAV
jgi:hypothetical protein